jgi:predicted nucleotidyltransferase component of viral defense system
MGKRVTTPNQEKFLNFVTSVPTLVDNFYFTGGTALAKYYLSHRFSEDLDFFSQEEVEPDKIVPFIHQAKEGLGFRRFDFQQAFNRNIFQLIFPKSKFLKVEFTYFPFEQINKPKSVDGLPVDSLLDIAVNKVFTIAQKPRGRDYFDLYTILHKQKDWNIYDLLKKARAKFDWHIDWLQFGSQLMKVEEARDDPILVGQKYHHAKIDNYFLGLSKEIGQRVVK